MLQDSSFRDVWSRTKAFRMPGVTDSQFITADKNIEFMHWDLARSGLDQVHMRSYTHPMLRLKEGATAGYVIPYFDLDGQPLVNDKGELIMYRTRLQYPEFSRESRYTQPSGESLLKYGLPSTLPYIHPINSQLEGTNVVCAEGEKKAASVLRYLGVPTFGIGGCQMWRSPDGSGSIHPWIRDFLRRRNADTVTIVPDGDIFRYDICNAYGTFARALESEGFKVRILNPGDKIDDLLVRWGPEAADSFAGLEQLDPNSLVQSPASLIKKYGLAFKPDSKDRPVVFQHTANIMRLMEAHPGFPRIWKNTDTARIHVGDAHAEPNLTEMQIANYFQYNLGFDKVTHRVIYSCVDTIARQNARSPMLEWIKEHEWDGKERLDTWMIRLWGMKDTEYCREVSAKWLLSACARMDKPGCKVDWMLIVVGPQGTGKTSMPGIMFRGNALTMYGEHNDKDLHMLLHSALCVGFDELDSFGKRESSNLKAMITRTEDAFRPPYGASVEVFPRRFTLYGCGNRYEFLQHDPSGYRRYAIMEAPRLLDFAGLEAERDQLWAEAWFRYSSGRERWWEIAQASVEAERYVVANPLEELITNWIASQFDSKSGTAVKDGVLYFNMTRLLSGIGMDRDVKNMHVTREIAAILRGLGAEQGNSSKEVVPGLRGRYYSIRGS